MFDEYKKYLGKIALNIKKERLKQKLSQEKLSELANLSLNCVHKIENVKQDVRLSSLYQIAEALGKELKDLV